MNNNLEQYIVAISGILDSIMSLESKQYEDNFKKSHINSIIDLLSKSVYGSQFGNRERFTKFITEIVGWEYADIVSLQQIQLNLISEERKEFKGLKEFVDEKLSGFPKARPIPIDFDISITELEKLYNTQLKINERFTLEHFTHKNLMYRYRNALIHEMRPAGTSFDLFDMSSPHYVSSTIVSKNKDTGKMEISNPIWQLNYPVDFYISLVNSSLEKVDINPYGNHKSDSQWVL